MKFNIVYAFLLVMALISMPESSYADGSIEDLARLIEQGDAAYVTHDDIIRITPDETRLLRLEEDAYSVVVTNPEHADVLFDSPRVLIIMPRLPGATIFRVLNKDGGVIMERSIIVTTSARSKYVRVRRACGPEDSTCSANDYYYCPDGCFKVREVEPSTGSSNIPAVPVDTNQVPVANAAPQQGSVPPQPGSVVPATPPPPSIDPSDNNDNTE